MPGGQKGSTSVASAAVRPASRRAHAAAASTLLRCMTCTSMSSVKRSKSDVPGRTAFGPHNPCKSGRVIASTLKDYGCSSKQPMKQ